MSSESMPFDPAWLFIEQMMGGRQTLSAEPVDQARAHFNGITAALQPMIPPPSDAVVTEDLQITDRNIPLRIYRPATGSTTNGLLPVGLYIHSGGWYTGSVDAEDHLCRNIAEGAQIILFAPDYRLAPEDPFPAGFEDVCAAYEYMHSHAAEYGGDSSRKVTMGGSAAGNLSACVALKYASDQTLKPVGMITACLSSCDPAVLPEEYKKRYTPELYADSPMISNEIVAQAREWYAAAKLDDPLYSPLLHPDIGLLPKTYVIACTKDPTHQETLFFYEECRKNGVDVEYKEYAGWPHFFWIIPGMPKSAEFLDDWNQKIKNMVSS